MINAKQPLLLDWIELGESTRDQSCTNQNELSVSSEQAADEITIVELKKKVGGKPSYVISAADLVSKKATEIPTLMSPFLPKVGIAVLVGSSDSGKSAWLRQLVTAIALRHREYLNFPLTCTHNAAIYVSTEDDGDSLAYLIQKQNVDKIPSSEFEKLRFIFETENLLAIIDAELMRLPSDVVVIDTLTDVFGANDFNNAIVVRAFLQQYQKLALKHQCLIIFNHHLSKASEFKVPSKSGVLGSMGIESKARILLELRKDRFDSSLRHLIPLKGNYLAADVKQVSIVLKFNDDMVFSNTGKTTMIEDLGGNSNINKGPELKDRASELKKEGKSIRAIVKILYEELGVDVGKSTVGEWVKSVNADKPYSPDKAALDEPEEGF